MPTAGGWIAACGSILLINTSAKAVQRIPETTSLQSTLATLPRTPKAANCCMPRHIKRGHVLQRLPALRKGQPQTIVGFPAHGRSKRKADVIAQGVA